ncbi:MAG: Fic family protein [Sulfurimonas sp.]|jgi:Fic family protein|nr:Fic family protein [Sulfurimonadaceae bacterium]
MENILQDTQIELINKIDYNIKENYDLNIFLAKKDRVDYIYNTAALEGNPYTFPEVQTLLEGISVGGHKLSDEKMILNQNESVNLLFELLKNREFSLSKPTLLKLHSKVAKEEALKWGEFRSGNIRISGTDYLPPKSQKLDEIFHENIKKLQKITHPINRAIVYFLLGARNQYFYDGNKRVSRLMMNGELLSHGFSLLNIKVKDQLEFNKTMINYYNTNDILEALGYLSDYYVKQNRELDA